MQSPRFLSIVVGDGLKRSDILQCAAEAAAIDWSKQKDVPKGFEKFFRPGGASGDAETSKEASNVKKVKEMIEEEMKKREKSGSDSEKKKSDGEFEGQSHETAGGGDGNGITR